MVQLAPYRRGSRESMRPITWKSCCALALLLPIYSWLVCVLPPLGAVEFALHMAEKGEHCFSFCEHHSDLTADPAHAHDAVEVCGMPCPLLVPPRVAPPAPLTVVRPPPLMHLVSGAFRVPPPFPHS